MKLRCDTWGVPYTKVSRAAVFKRDGYVCQLCGEPIDPKLRYPNPKSKSLDHIVPLSHGPGTPGHVFSNAQAAHFGCNASKGNRV
jgi:5-methylcytosine-specific restriction endonuclease McrA